MPAIQNLRERHFDQERVAVVRDLEGLAGGVHRHADQFGADIRNGVAGLRIGRFEAGELQSRAVPVQFLRPAQMKVEPRRRLPTLKRPPLAKLRGCVRTAAVAWSMRSSSAVQVAHPARFFRPAEDLLRQIPSARRCIGRAASPGSY